MSQPPRGITPVRPKESAEAEYLSARDKGLLQLLGEYGCVTADRIKSQFWNENPKSRAHYRRLGILKRRGFVENVHGDGSGTLGYRLTPKGKEYFAGVSGAGSTQATRRSYKTQFEHDQLLIDVRRILEKSPLVKEFKKEQEVRREYLNEQTKMHHWERHPTIPDGLFTFETPEQRMRIAIELELSFKSKQRYVRIFRNHLLSKDWKLVIYIVKDEKFRDQLMKLLSQIKETDIQIRIEKTLNGIYFCSLDNFLSMRLATPLSNGKDKISLEQIAHEFGLKSKPEVKGDAIAKQVALPEAGR